LSQVQASSPVLLYATSAAIATTRIAPTHYHSRHVSSSLTDLHHALRRSSFLRQTVGVAFWIKEHRVLVSEPDPWKFPRVWLLASMIHFGSVYYPLQRWHGVAGERENSLNSFAGVLATSQSEPI